MKVILISLQYKMVPVAAKLTVAPWPSGGASASRAEGLGVEARFPRVESYQYLNTYLTAAGQFRL